MYQTSFFYHVLMRSYHFDGLKRPYKAQNSLMLKDVKRRNWSTTRIHLETFPCNNSEKILQSPPFRIHRWNPLLFFLRRQIAFILPLLQDLCKDTYSSLNIAVGSEIHCTATNSAVERHNVRNMKGRSHFPRIIQLLVSFILSYWSSIGTNLFLMCIMNYSSASWHVSSASWLCKVTSAFPSSLFP